MSGEETYPAPEHGWVCFHCGDHFPGTHDGARQAREHFGDHVFATPACQIWGNSKSWRSAYRMLIRHLRTVERELRDLHRRVADEDTDKDREIAALIGRQATISLEAEEDGYAKGLRDGRAETICDATSHIHVSAQRP